MDEYYLTQALAQAESRKGFTAPNPAVGAVLVKHRQIIAVGTHWQAGMNHAEVDALAKTDQANGTTLYVTLEPCCHYGKTPPCVDAIIKAGIVRVVYGQMDPNPRVAGRGIAQLQASGVVCQYVPLPTLVQFYASYVYRYQQQRPWLCGKLALTLDGKVADVGGRPMAITGLEAQHFTHQQRRRHDLILTSARTIENDDAQMNARIDAAPVAKTVAIVDRLAQLSLTARIWQTAEKILLMHSDQADAAKVSAWQARGAITIVVPETTGHLDLSNALTQLAHLGYSDIWLEAGGTLLAAFAEQQLLNELYCYVAPWWAGASTQSAFSQAHFLKTARHRRWQALGEDAVLHLEF